MKGKQFSVEMIEDKGGIRNCGTVEWDDFGLNRKFSFKFL